MCVYIFLHCHHVKNVTIFLSKYISKGAVDMKFSPDVGNIRTHTYIQRKQNNKFRNKLCVIKWNDTGKSIEHLKKRRCKKA